MFSPFSPYMDLLLFTFFILFMAILFNKRPISKHPPGPWKLPIIGSIHHLVGKAPERSLRDLATKFGPLMHLQLGEIPNLVVSTAEVAENIMKIHDLNFADRPPIVSMEMYTYGFTDVGLAPYGNYWRKMRKICVLELLTAKRVESFKSVREDEVLGLIRAFATSADTATNFKEKIHSLTNNIVFRAAFGNKSVYQDALLSTMREAFESAGGFQLPDLFPSMKFLKVMTGMTFREEKFHRKMDDIFNSIIEEHRERHRSLKRNLHEVEDLVDVLLRLQQDGDLDVPITTDNIKAIILDMFAGGTDTANKLISWAMAELMRNPSAMVKAQEEVRRVLSGQSKVSETAIHEDLEYLKLVIKEALRLHPPIPMLLPRECRESCEIKGYVIPKKTRVLINAWAIGREAKQWGEDAERFKPERFLNSSVDFKGTNFEFIPFGAGRRMCPGVLFGIANVELALAQLLYYFDWELPQGMKPEDVDIMESSVSSGHLRSDLYLIPLIHNPLPA